MLPADVPHRSVASHPGEDHLHSLGSAPPDLFAAMAPDPLPAGQIALRGCLLVAATLLALVLADATPRGAASVRFGIETVCAS